MTVSRPAEAQKSGFISLHEIVKRFQVTHGWQYGEAARQLRHALDEPDRPPWKQHTDTSGIAPAEALGHVEGLKLLENASITGEPVQFDRRHGYDYGYEPDISRIDRATPTLGFLRAEMGQFLVRNGLLEQAESEAWLRASAGYRVPRAESGPVPTPAVPVSVAEESAPDRGRRVKRAALIADHVRRWVTIERDLKDAATNGLSKAAKDDGAVGWWWEGSALEWARARAKVQDVPRGLAGMTSTIHRLEG